jgi:phage terminase large subunit GpA-like protein
MENVKLKPCPHCGESKLLEIEATERNDRPQCKWTATVTCLRCFATAGTHGFEWTKEDAKREAKAAWNRRINDVTA